MITQDYLKSILDYDPETGAFKWKINKGKIKIGQNAGSFSPKVGVKICIDYVTHLAHHLAWLYVYGKWPVDQIDHKNGIKSDNWILNLRECTQSENNQNRTLQSNNTSGYIGVSQTVSGRYSATIQIQGSQHYLGLFDCPKEAHAAYVKAKSEFHTFNPKIPERALIAQRTA